MSGVEPKQIVVVGAGRTSFLLSRSHPASINDVFANTIGVVGLTTAVKIQEKGGYQVTIVAETFPSDPKTIRYTSLWAV